MTTQNEIRELGLEIVRALGFTTRTEVCAEMTVRPLLTSFVAENDKDIFEERDADIAAWREANRQLTAQLSTARALLKYALTSMPLTQTALRYQINAFLPPNAENLDKQHGGKREVR